MYSCVLILEILVLQIDRIIKYSPEIAKPFREAFSEPITFRFVEISKAASESITNAQRGLISAQEVSYPLNRSSFYSDFFGVKSASNIQEQLKNQMALSWLKTQEQGLGTFPSIVLYAAPDTKLVQKSLKNLRAKKFGRFTVSDKIFGPDYKSDTHTVGIVYHKDKYFILDSLSEKNPKIKDYHKRLVDYLGLDPKEVVFSTKPQQKLDEYTCNNWTHANLDAVRDYLAEKGADTELTPEILDQILPDNINKVLYHQFLYTDGKLKGRDISAVVAEHYSTKNKSANFATS